MGLKIEISANHNKALYLFHELYLYRDLFWSWIIRDIKIRYKQSLLGGLWAILQPLALTVLFVLVFSYFVRIPTDGFPYPIFSYTALLPWTFLASAITFGVPSLVGNMNLVTKIYFPREIIPLASVAVSLVDFSIASVVLIGMMFFYNIPFRITLIWVPLLVLVQTLLVAGVILIASALNALYRDIRFVVPLAIQVWMYASPIIYPLSVVPERLRQIYLLNPMAGLIDGYRNVILKGTSPNLWVLGSSSAMALVVFLAGYYIFKRLEGTLPDVI